MTGVEVEITVFDADSLLIVFLLLELVGSWPLALGLVRRLPVA